MLRDSVPIVLLSGWLLVFHTTESCALPETGELNTPMPRERRWLTYLIVLFLWIAIAIIAALFSYDYRLHIGKPASWSELSRLYLIAYLVWGVLFTPVVVFTCSRVRIDRHNWHWAFLLHNGVALSIAVVNALLRIPLQPLMYPSAPQPVHMYLFRRYFLGNAFDDIWMYWIVAAIAHGWMYYQAYQERGLRASQLEAQLAQAQLQMLKMQLHPHFLFNTLNSISVLMRRDVEAAEGVITKLGDLLRMTLDSADQQQVTMRSELEFVSRYLEIERIRFKDRLSIRFSVDADCLDAQVPNMLLQPLVENAIRYGVAPYARPGAVEISAKRVGDELHLTVWDTGKGIQEPTRREGIGLSNTRARLRELYGIHHQFELRNAEGAGLAVNVQIPFIRVADGTTNLITVSSLARPTTSQGSMGWATYEDPGSHRG